jgi:hypothetical protein
MWNECETQASVEMLNQLERLFISARFILPTFFQSKKSRQKCFCPNYGVWLSCRCGPIHGKRGSGSEMQSRSSFTNTAGLALSGIGSHTGSLSLLRINNRTGDNFEFSLRSSGRVIGQGSAVAIF